MSVFGGLRKHEKTQDALVDLGSAALAAGVALPGQGGQNFLTGIIHLKKNNNNYGSSDAGVSVDILSHGVCVGRGVGEVAALFFMLLSSFVFYF